MTTRYTRTREDYIIQIRETGAYISEAKLREPTTYDFALAQGHTREEVLSFFRDTVRYKAIKRTSTVSIEE